MTALSSCLIGCVDPEGAYDDFAKRSGAQGGSGGGDGGGPCTPPAPGSVDGPVFLAVTLDLRKGLPFTYAGTLESAEQDGKTAFTLNIAPLNYTDRSTPAAPVAPRGPYVIEPDGSVNIVIPEELIPAAANHLLKTDTPVENLRLTGQFCANTEVQCGTVLLNLTKPIEQKDVAGTYTLTLLGDDGTTPPDPLYYNCAKDVAGPPPQ